MELPSRTEEFILLAVYHLREKAYGITIKKRLEEWIGKRFSVGAVYVPLERLRQKGLLSTSEAKPKPRRGGRRKRIYKLTDRGLSALNEIRNIQTRLWNNISNFKQRQSQTT